MIRISVWPGDFSDSYLRHVTQLGVDCIDFGAAEAFPGVAQRGVPDLAGVLAIKRKLSSWGLAINRVTLPNISPIARQRFGGDAMPHRTQPYQSVHRGGYLSRGEYAHRSQPEPRSPEALDGWWDRFRVVYGRLVPIAEEVDVKLALHPSDTPYAGTPFDSLGYHRVIDLFPNRCVGYLYCIGTRAEAGGSSLVLDPCWMTAI